MHLGFEILMNYFIPIWKVIPGDTITTYLEQRRSSIPFFSSASAMATVVDNSGGFPTFLPLRFPVVVESLTI